MLLKTLGLLCNMVVLASAHMKMSLPTPYGKSTLDNSPLLRSGADFPCKLRPGVYDVEGASNVYALGSTNPLKFIGQAVHGGGSCQVSITYDTQPTRNSTWKIIKSIEGGCPAQNQTGNMGGDANAANPFEYDFTIPPDIPSGNITIGWTWFNKIGIREMYMNCGPATLTGTGGSMSNFYALPDMFKANINNGCGVPDNKDVVFPNPGKDVTRMNGATTAFAAPTGPSCGVANSSRPTPALTIEPSPPKSVTTPQSSVASSHELPKPSCGSSSGRSGINSSSIGTPCIREGLWSCFEESLWNCIGSNHL